MKFCERCGQELSDDAIVCTRCGVSVKKEEVVSQGRNYYSIVGNTTGVFATAIVLMVIAALNALGSIVLEMPLMIGLSAFLCLIAEIVALIPRGKLASAVKTNNPTMNKEQLKIERKKVSANLSVKFPGFKNTTIAGYVAFALFFIFFVLANVLVMAM